MALTVESSSFGNGDRIPEAYAFGVPAAEGHAAPAGGNHNPHLRWSGAPEGTRSYAVLCMDVDVPTVFDDFNTEGRTLAADMPRQEFPHWVVVDIPPDVTEIAEGADSDGITPRGKAPGPTPYGGIRGVNGYTQFMQGDMAGQYGGYDGPFPPWNDERPHRYHFRVVALDVDSLGLSGGFTVADAEEAMRGHVLDQAEWVGWYSLNPDVRG
jgi:Raf kinase inhibitor-like YbhB/YbcL family protein